MVWFEVFFNGLHHLCHIRFINLWQHVGGIIHIFEFFFLIMRCTLSSFTPVISQSKIYLHLWWNRKMASFRLFWAITEICCPLLGIPLAFLPTGFLTTLQMPSTFLSVRTLSHSWLSSTCSLTSSLAALRLHTCLGAMKPWSQFLMSYVPEDPPCMLPNTLSFAGGSLLWEFQFLHILHQDQLHFVLEHLAWFWVLTLHSLCLGWTLIWLCILQHLFVLPAKDVFQALWHLLSEAWVLGFPLQALPILFWVTNNVN